MKVQLDINIVDTYNSKTIAIADSSVYDPYKPPVNAVIEITPPGFVKVAIPFTVQSVNTFNSNNVGITNACDNDRLAAMPDGIWLFKYSVLPNAGTSISRYHLRTAMITCSLQQTFLSSLLSVKKESCSASDIKVLQDAQILLTGAATAAREDQLLAIKLYRKAETLIKQYSGYHCDGCVRHNC